VQLPANEDWVKVLFTHYILCMFYVSSATAATVNKYASSSHSRKNLMVSSRALVAVSMRSWLRGTSSPSPAFNNKQYCEYDEDPTRQYITESNHCPGCELKHTPVVADTHQ